MVSAMCRTLAWVCVLVVLTRHRGLSTLIDPASHGLPNAAFDRTSKLFFILGVRLGIWEAGGVIGGVIVGLVGLAGLQRENKYVDGRTAYFKVSCFVVGPDGV
ncbi:hypothetical protein C8R44DRAFT_753587 [Mycena epipterygia]|nr:hypothetical protein C8R44DRAFT_753587 [Mycena epipterygia]